MGAEPEVLNFSRYVPIPSALIDIVSKKVSISFMLSINSFGKEIIEFSKITNKNPKTKIGKLIFLFPFLLLVFAK
jgi:hypothetical protein